MRETHLPRIFPPFKSSVPPAPNASRLEHTMNAPVPILNDNATPTVPPYASSTEEPFVFQPFVDEDNIPGAIRPAPSSDNGGNHHDGPVEQGNRAQLPSGHSHLDKKHEDKSSGEVRNKGKGKAKEDDFQAWAEPNTPESLPHGSHRTMSEPGSPTTGFQPFKLDTNKQRPHTFAQPGYHSLIRVVSHGSSYALINTPTQSRGDSHSPTHRGSSADPCQMQRTPPNRTAPNGGERRLDYQSPTGSNSTRQSQSPPERPPDQFTQTSDPVPSFPKDFSHPHVLPAHDDKYWAARAAKSFIQAQYAKNDRAASGLTTLGALAEHQARHDAENEVEREQERPRNTFAIPIIDPNSSEGRHRAAMAVRGHVLSEHAITPGFGGVSPPRGNAHEHGTTRGVVHNPAHAIRELYIVQRGQPVAQQGPSDGSRCGTQSLPTGMSSYSASFEVGQQLHQQGTQYGGNARIVSLDHDEDRLGPTIEDCRALIRTPPRPAADNNVVGLLPSLWPEVPQYDNGRVTNFVPGDWICRMNYCDFHNFGRNAQCMKCGHPRPRGTIIDAAGHDAVPTGQSHHHHAGFSPPLGSDGDWKCRACKFINWRRRTFCYICYPDHPTNQDRRNRFNRHDRGHHNTYTNHDSGSFAPRRLPVLYAEGDASTSQVVVSSHAGAYHQYAQYNSQAFDNTMADQQHAGHNPIPSYPWHTDGEDAPEWPQYSPHHTRRL